MPALPPAVACLKFQLRHTLGLDSNIITNWHMKYASGTPGNAELAALAAAVGADWSNSMAPYCASNVTVVSCVIQDLSGPAGSIGEATFSHAGTLSGTFLPAGTCAVLNFAINRRYRGGKPKVFLPYMRQEELAAPQAWTSLAAANIANAWTAFMGLINGSAWSGSGGLTQVNVGYYEGFKVITDPITGRARNVPVVRATPHIDTVAGVVCRLAPGSQRRRNTPGG